MEVFSQMSELSLDDANEGVEHKLVNGSILPKPFDIRQYQFDIVDTVLSNNTLVCLPTGKCYALCFKIYK